MKIKIIPCVCTELKNDGSDSVYSGMPILYVTDYYESCDTQFYAAKCPKCGRGGLIQYKSAYLALRAWNKMQKQVRIKDYSDFLEPVGMEN